MPNNPVSMSLVTTVSRFDFAGFDAFLSNGSSTLTLSVANMGRHSHSSRGEDGPTRSTSTTNLNGTTPRPLPVAALSRRLQEAGESPTSLFGFNVAGARRHLTRRAVINKLAEVFAAGGNRGILGHSNLAVSNLKKKPKYSIMLMSLKCGGVSLNLTCTNRVVSLDLACCAHQFGQEKPIFVKRVMLTNTVEQRILALQKGKQDITDSTLGEGTGKKLKRMTASELATLFNLNTRGEVLELKKNKELHKRSVAPSIRKILPLKYIILAVLHHRQKSDIIIIIVIIQENMQTPLHRQGFFLDGGI
ncbi:hypothetical protein PtB15_8B92 [Puccinia triticina]|nr:hypothetical protein PtB15_8B92 [Puccinia triticina]